MGLLLLGRSLWNSFGCCFFKARPGDEWGLAVVSPPLAVHRSGAKLPFMAAQRLFFIFETFLALPASLPWVALLAFAWFCLPSTVLLEIRVRLCVEGVLLLPGH